MLILAIILLIIAAGLGAILIISVLKNKCPSKSIVYAHGIMAAAVVFLIFLVILKDGLQPLLVICLLLLILTATLGFILYRIGIQKKGLQAVMVISHLLLVGISLIAFVTYLLLQYVVAEEAPGGYSRVDSPCMIPVAIASILPGKIGGKINMK